MNCSYALYDALISIDVPADKASAVVGAMEQDMTSSFATKMDIQGLEQRVGHEFELVRKDMKALESSMAAGLKALDQSTALRIKALEDSTAQNFKAMEDSTALKFKAMEDSTSLKFKAMEESTALSFKAMEDSTAQKFKAMAESDALSHKALERAIIAKVGGMLAAGFGLSIAALKLMI